MAIVTANEAGMSLRERGDHKDMNGDFVKTQQVCVGTPMTLPFGNPCTNFQYDDGCGFWDPCEYYSYTPSELRMCNYYAPANEIVGYAGFNFSFPIDKDKGALYYYTSFLGKEPEMDEASDIHGWSPFSTKGLSQAFLNLELYRATFSPEAEILMECYGMDEPESIATIAKGDRDGEVYHTAIRIPEKFMDKPWVRAYLKINPKNLKTQPNQLFMFGSYFFDIKSGVASAHLGEGSVTSDNGTITVSGYEGKPVSIYSLRGVSIFSTVSASDCEKVTVPQGVYIVRAADETMKIMVK